VSPRVDPHTGDLVFAADEPLEAATGERGREDPRVAIALDAVERSQARLRIVRDGVEADAFPAAEAVALLLPRAAGERALRVLPASAAPVAIAQLVGLGPRLRPAGEPLRVPAGTLATALTQPRDQDLLAPPLSHWRIERPPRALEIVDTGRGLFMVRADRGDAILAPTTPTRAFRGIVRLLRG
jgi:hypothetical protein